MPTAPWNQTGPAYPGPAAFAGKPSYKTYTPYVVPAAVVAAFAVFALSVAFTPGNAVNFLLVLAGFVVVTVVVADYGFYNASAVETDGNHLWCHAVFQSRVVDLQEVDAFEMRYVGKSRQASVVLTNGRRLRVSTSFGGGSFIDCGRMVSATVAPWVRVLP